MMLLFRAVTEYVEKKQQENAKYNTQIKEYLAEVLG